MNNQSGITLLDGAMGAALRERGVNVPDYKSSVWSALALIEAPDEVRTLHRDYIRAGAEVITTNNYAVAPISLARGGLEARLAELTVTAGRLAREARDGESAIIRIAGSLPPLNTSYRADLVGPYDELLAVYQTIARELAPHVDLFLCETMTTTVEARAAATAAVAFGKPVWVSWTLDETTGALRGGESIAAARAALADLPVDAFLFNCCSDRAVAKGLPDLAWRADRPFGAYANPFRHEPEEEDQSSINPAWLSPQAYAEATARWMAQGATIIGGCCGTNPDYTRALSHALAIDEANCGSVRS